MSQNPSWESSPLNLIALGRDVHRVDPLVDKHLELVHSDVVGSDHVLLELHFQVIIKKHQHEINPDNRLLNFIFAFE